MSKKPSRPQPKSSRLSGLRPLGKILGKLNLTRDKYISREWQAYGIRLAKELNDSKRKTLYIKMARDEPRAILEQARRFVKDAQARNQAALWMWKVQQLKKEATIKKAAPKK